jgi:hypothetical protein
VELLARVGAWHCGGGSTRPGEVRDGDAVTVKQTDARGREGAAREGAAVLGIFMRVSSVRHGRMEAMQRRDFEDGRPWPSSIF